MVLNLVMDIIISLINFIIKYVIFFLYIHLNIFIVFLLHQKKSFQQCIFHNFHKNKNVSFFFINKRKNEIKKN